MVIQTKWKRAPRDNEPGGGKDRVERSGYLSSRKRINRLIAAGEQLERNRSDVAYHLNDPNDSDTNIEPANPYPDRIEIEEAAKLLNRRSAELRKKAVEEIQQKQKTAEEQYIEKRVQEELAKRVPPVDPGTN